MCYKCLNSLLAALIVIFSFWQISASKWIIIIAAVVILIRSIIELVMEGCSGNCYIGPCGTSGHKTGEEIFLDKSPKSEMPSKGEVKEVMVKKKVAKKKVAKKAA